MANPRRVLAIHAHPDDIEFQCAGTLALLKERGHHITMATMTPGDCGSDELAPDAISDVRRKEAQAAADLIGAELHCLEFRDLSIVFDNESRRRVTEFIRRQRPDIVMTAPPVDYMADHEVTSRLVRDACFNASFQTTGLDSGIRLLPHVRFRTFTTLIRLEAPTGTGTRSSLGL